ncbi:hypothetical protein Barb7_02462 [Bacteroidales bacterium Barb7]|nr:hypothetical protein Barb7_02462 [Bacteroidales bacterium Barb7]
MYFGTVHSQIGISQIIYYHQHDIGAFLLCVHIVAKEQCCS